MEVTLLWAYLIPAIAALTFKAGLFLYAYARRSKRSLTRIYLFLLGAFAIQNVVIIAGYPALAHGTVPYFEANLFYVSTLFVIALILHLAMRMAIDERSVSTNAVIKAGYVAAVVLTLLILNTSWVISGYEITDYVITRVPGPLYFLFSIYAGGSLVAGLSILAYGSLRQTTPQKRLKNQLLFLALIPMQLAMIVVLLLLNMGVKSINLSILSPILITYVLGVTAYAIHQHRLFDIQFYIPWSKVRKRKNAFYSRIHAVIAEIADLDSVDSAVRKLSETLQCGVALVGTGPKPVLALAGGPRSLADVPIHTLSRFDHIVVRNEIAEVRPDVHGVLKHHGVAAAVPFHPHSQYASGWLLLGESFNEQIYTKRDFRVVEELFDKMADLFLDRLLDMRAQLQDTMRQVRALEKRQEELHTTIELLQEQNASLRQQNVMLLKQQPADSLRVHVGRGDFSQVGSMTVTVVGDKKLYKELRSSLPQISHVAHLSSAAFRRQGLPDVLIRGINQRSKDAHELLELIKTQPGLAMLLYGSAACDVLAEHKVELRGTLIEVLPDDFTNEIVVRRVHALEALKEACKMGSPDQPLIGKCAAFAEQMAEAHRLAVLAEPVLLLADDEEQAFSLARYMHMQDVSRADANLSVIDAQQFAQEGTAEIGPGTLVLKAPEHLTESENRHIGAHLQTRPDLRVIAISAAPQPGGALASVFGFRIRMPSLRERRADLPLLVHYFTLQFNLQTGATNYLRQAEIDDIMADRYPTTVTALRQMVFEMLKAKLEPCQVDIAFKPELTEKTLDEHIAEYENHIIQETLKRCGGNKSKAARLLGLRPNTLHYKLERNARKGTEKCLDS